MIGVISRPRTAAAQMLRALAIIGFGIGLVYLVVFVEFASVMFEVFSDINWTKDSATNARGDKAEAATEASGHRQDPDKTIVRLRRAHHWFSTTLVEAESFGVQEHLAWRNNDALDVTLAFGCLTHMTQPIEQIGSIRISYQFTNGDKALSKGCPD
jgi:hypothetical protein